MTIQIDVLATLRTRRYTLIRKFYGIPRIFDEEEWLELLQAYIDAGAIANVADVKQRIENYKYMLWGERTPMTAADAELPPWQLRADIR